MRGVGVRVGGGTVAVGGAAVGEEVGTDVTVGGRGVGAQDAKTKASETKQITIGFIASNS
jgi:hypothetical protein